MNFSVIVPVYNEEGNLYPLIDRLKNVMATFSEKLTNFTYELIFVNDGSADNSMNILRDLAKKHEEVVYINLSRNFGHQVAVSAGLDHAQGEYIAIIDADLQDPPELLIEMHQKCLDGFDVVYAKRKKRHGESYFKKITATVYYRIIRRITSIDIPVDVGDFRIIHRRIANVIKQMPETNKFLRGQISWAGFKQTYVEYDRAERNEGATGYSFKKMSQFALDGITAFSDAPLKVATTLGFMTFIVSFVLIIYALYSRFVLQDFVDGWTSTIISVLFIGGIQMLCLGIIGEYLIRILNNSRNRPLYLIAESNLEDKKRIKNSIKEIANPMPIHMKEEFKFVEQ